MKKNPVNNLREKEIFSRNYKHQLCHLEDTLKENSYNFSKECSLFQDLFAHSREFLNKSNYSKVNTGGHVVLFLV